MLHPDLLVGTETGDDAAVWRRPDGRALVTTVDFFAPVVDDAYSWGEIAAANAASDVFAMGGNVLFALNVAVWPREVLPFAVLTEVLQGAAATARRGGWVVTGGHTVDGPEPMFGQVVVGEVDEATITRNTGAQPGDVLVLTKPLGTGVITTAHKRLPAADTAPGGIWGPAFAAARSSMTRLNAAAARAAVIAGAHAVTDVTGFGLGGHLHKILRSSGRAATIEAAALPLLPQVKELIGAGFVPGGTERNLAFVGELLIGGGDVERAIIGDPQTSGGLLIACPPTTVGRLLDDLGEFGAAPGDAAVIGHIGNGVPGSITLD